MKGLLTSISEIKWSITPFVDELIFTNICIFAILTLSFQVTLASAKEKPRCPGISPRWGVSIDCILTKRGVQSYNCSSPVPQETVAFYNCQKYFKQISASSPIKLMRCGASGAWTRVEHFKNLKCEYECGKAQPITKTLIINDRITTRQIWPWHALIYYRLDISDLEVISKKQPEDIAKINSKILLNEAKEPDSNSKNRNSNNNRIARAYGNEFYQVYICGGSLISPTKILTAAHCFTNGSGFARNPKDFTVILGGISSNFYSNRQDSSSQVISVDKINISDSFNYEKFEGDIAIITLSRPAQLSNMVFPACLPNIDDHLFISNGKHGEVIGSRPQISRDGFGLSTQLKSKKLHVLPTIECFRTIDRIPSDKEYCAGMPEEFICGGDSGGGMISSPNFGLRRRYTIQGIVSYARARKLCENYAVFTRVYKFMDWISEIMKNEVR